MQFLSANQGRRARPVGESAGGYGAEDLLWPTAEGAWTSRVEGSAHVPSAGKLPEAMQGQARSTLAAINGET